jgi:membrane protein insertase Oxa1/YidC/SpoIIIJ
MDLGRAAIGPQGLYIPALIIVIGSAVTQYFQAKQLMPNDKDARSLRAIMREAGQGKQADQSEVGAAIGQSTKYFLPVMIFVFTINIASALGLYWFVGGLVAFIQQSFVLREDSEEMDELSKGKPNKRDLRKIPEAEVVAGSADNATDTAANAGKAGKAELAQAVEPSKKSKKANKSKRAEPIRSYAGTTVTSITKSKKGRKA